jgi:DNA-binding transcriptional LysR family regulator
LPAASLEPALARLSFKHLLCLQALVEERSVSTAARRMGMSQSAMSSVVGRLQLAFRQELFRRTPHGIVPTGLALELARGVSRVAEIAAAGTSPTAV